MADRAFVALANPVRRRLVEWLAENGPTSASALARQLPISRQAVSEHIAVLLSASLVVPETAGREVRYRLDPAPLSGVLTWTAGLAARWDERLAALQRTLEADHAPTSNSSVKPSKRQ